MTDGQPEDERKVEVELKYAVVDLRIGERLLGSSSLADFHATGAPTSTRHDDRYLDTAAGAFADAGYALRLRTADGRTTVNVKSTAMLDGSLQRREELEGSAGDPADPATWPPSEARAKTLEIAHGAPLVELVTIRQLRRKRNLATVDGRAAVELSLDEVDVLGGRRILEHFIELELELTHGSPEDLGPLRGLLDGSHALTPATGSKLDRSLAAVRRAGLVDPASAAQPDVAAVAEPEAPTEAETVADEDDDPSFDELDDLDESDPGTGGPGVLMPIAELHLHRSDDEPPEETTIDIENVVDEPELMVEAAAADPQAQAKEPKKEAGWSIPVGKTAGVTAEDTHGEAGRKVLRLHLSRMIEREAGTREGKDPEELHAMRVATRRMRAAWRVFGDAYRPERIRPFGRRLRTLAGRLGVVRDLDVLIEATEAFEKTLPEAERAGLEPLLSGWRSERDEGRRLLARELDSGRYRRFVEDFRTFVLTTGDGMLPVDPTLPHRVRDTAGSRIMLAYEHVRAYESVLRWADVETLHELRIAAKRLRYTLEFVREALGPEAPALIARVVALQDHLGLMNDAEVGAHQARTFLLAKASTLDEHQAAAISRYLVACEREVARLKRSVGTPWRGVAGLTFRRALGRTIAAL